MFTFRSELNQFLQISCQVFSPFVELDVRGRSYLLYKLLCLSLQFTFCFKGWISNWHTLDIQKQLFIICDKQFFFLIYRSHQYPGNFSTGFNTQIPAQQIQTVPLVSPVPQSPNAQIPSIQPAVQPIQLIEYNGVPTIIFGTVYDQLYYSSPPYVPSPTLPVTTVSPSFTYQTVAPQTPPLNGGSLCGQHFFPTHLEIIGQPQNWVWRIRRLWSWTEFAKSSYSWETLNYKN